MSVSNRQIVRGLVVGMVLALGVLTSLGLAFGGCAVETSEFSDIEGEPDYEGKSRGSSGWRNGAPVATKPGPKRTSGFRGGRAVTPQMTAPTPK